MIPRDFPGATFTYLRPTNQDYILASVVIFFYDYLLTLDREVKLVWSQKFTPVNLLILALRYVTIVGYVLSLFASFAQLNDNVSTEKIFNLHAHSYTTDVVLECALAQLCSGFALLPGILGIICEALIIVFLIIRNYAIYERNRWSLAITIPLGVLSLAMGSLALADSAALTFLNTVNTGSGTAPAPIACFLIPGIFTLKRKHSLFKFRISYICTITFDTVVFLLSFYKMFRMRQEQKALGSCSGIVYVLLRDGCVLYAFLASSNIANFIFFELSWDKTLQVIGQFDVIFAVSSGTNCEMTHALSVCLLSRMVFNLREAGTEVYEGTNVWRSRIERGVATVPMPSLRTIRFREPSSSQFESESNMGGPGDVSLDADYVDADRNRVEV